MIRILLLSTALYLLTTQVIQAEPWLGNRYAQNCAGCHAPGRKNLKPIDRRCSLSCQGCHINPNGGGMRSFYGKWNQNRWLRSFRSPIVKETRSVEPSPKQVYGRIPYQKRKRKNDKKIYYEGLPLREKSDTYVNEAIYDRRDGLEFKTSRSWREFLYQVPDDDPYRMFDKSRADASGDFRWLWLSLQNEETDNEQLEGSAFEWRSFMMNFDYGIRFRPIHRYVHLVYEGRMLGSTNEQQELKDTLRTSQTRSLYAMVDNLPYNVFVMGGYYRPLIGSSGADHTLLSQRMLSYALTGNSRIAQRIMFNAATIGTAPNVPFANVHYIMRRKEIGGDIDGDRTKGFAVNTGLRFVTLGAAVNYTYWKTVDNNEKTNEKTSVEIYTFGLSGMYKRLTLGLEAWSLVREVDTKDFRRGGVYQLETRTRLWREYYLVGHYALGNTTPELLPGSSSQMKVGFRGFHLAGVDTSITYDIDTVKYDGNDDGEGAYEYTTNYISAQLHLYF